MLIIIDDVKARKTAREENVDLIGTLGVLKLGYIKCPIKTKDKLEEFIRRLRDVLYFTEDLEKWTLEAEKE